MNEMEEKSKEAQQSEPAVWAKLCAYGHMQDVELERIHTPRIEHDDLYGHDLFDNINNNNLSR